MYGLEDFNEDVKLALKAQLYLNVGELSLSHAQEGFLGPLAEPVNRASINETGEHSQPCGKGLPNRTHTHDNMYISLNPGQVHGEYVHLIRLQVLLGTITFTTVNYVLHVFLVVHVSHVATVQNAIDVLKHLFVYDLSVNEEEGDGLVLDSSCEQDILNVLAPVLHGVVLNNLNLPQGIVHNKRRHLRQRLPATPADPQQKCISLWLPNNPGYPGNMFTCIQEHN